MTPRWRRAVVRGRFDHDNTYVEISATLYRNDLDHASFTIQRISGCTLFKLRIKIFYQGHGLFNRYRE